MSLGRKTERAAQAIRNREKMEKAVAEEAETPRVTITLIEAAKRLGIGRNQAYEAAHRGEIPTLKLGGRYLVPLPAFELMLRGSK
jgi:excisionase family DNA binding protein